MATITTLANSGISYFSNRLKAILDTNFSNLNTAVVSAADIVNDTTPQLGGDLDVNGQAITSASNGDVTINPNGTGEIDLAKPVLTSSTSSRSGAGAVPLTASICELTTTGADALTLADGIEGQRLTIVMIVDGGDGTLTPANAGGYTTITFADAGDSVDLLFTNGNWYVTGKGGLTTGPAQA